MTRAAFTTKTTREIIQARIDARGAAQARAADLAYETYLNSQAARGIYPHRVDPADPWADIVMRQCEPGCAEHADTT